MSADWFCKIGEKKIGPLNGQQLKTIVAKGQLKPEHLVRRGSEGPWVPAGRIKGLFPEGPAGKHRARSRPGHRQAFAQSGAKPGTPPTAKAATCPRPPRPPPRPPPTSPRNSAWEDITSTTWR